MCPDRELLSAFADGEVPSPWRERIALHLGACVDCSRLVERYASVGAALRSEDCPGQAPALERVAAFLETRLAGQESSAAPAAASPERANLPHSWRRAVVVPLPLAAAAILAIILMGGLSATLALRPAAAAAQSLAADIGPSAAKQASMEALLEYLQSQDAQVTLTLKLPKDATFANAGAPVIMRARGSP